MSTSAPPPKIPATLWPPAAPTFSTTPAIAADVPKDPGSVEICGVGQVKTDAEDPFAARKVLSKLTDPRFQEWLSALRNSDDNRARAAGLLLQGKVGGALQGQVMTDEDRDALVQLAVGSGDPAVYAMAVYACHAYANPVPDSACEQISVSTWASMDSDNAVPWLLLAELARVRRDDTGAGEAFARAANAGKIDSYNYSLFAFADSDQPKDTTPLERWAFAEQVSGAESSLGPPYGTAMVRHCSDDAVRNTTVRQQCSAVAELFATKSTTAIDFARAASFGKSAGWPAERVDALTQEQFALSEAGWQAWPTDTDLWSCAGVSRGNDYWRARLRLGELGALREAMEKTGESARELARDLRKRLSNFPGNVPTGDEQP